MADICVLIVEDEALYADKMEMQLEKLGYAHQATVDNSRDALTEIKRKIPDLILMDIHIQGEYDGIELAEKVQALATIPLIFVTSLKDDRTFLRAKRTQPVGFLIKPFDEIQLQRSMELAVGHLEQGPATAEDIEVFTPAHFFIKNRHKLEKVLFEAIIYINADGRYTQIITAHKKYLIRRSFREVHQRLHPLPFAQSHRSYALNLRCVNNVDLSEMVVYLDGGNHAPLSKRMKDDFLNRLNRV